MQLAIVWPCVFDHVYSVCLQHRISSRSDATSILRRQRQKGPSLGDKGVAGSLASWLGPTRLKGKFVSGMWRKLMTLFPVCASLSTGTQIWNLISGHIDAACVCVCVCVLFTVISLAPLSLQHLYRPHILLQLDLQDLILPAQKHAA